MDREREQTLLPLWRMPFRPMFLGAAVWSCIALCIWLAQLRGISLPAVRGGVTWHAHEMLFGFAGAVVVGFITTAMQTWTGLRAPTGRPLIALSALWLAARLGYAFAGVPLWLPVLLESGFFLVAAVLTGRRILAVRQWRNLFVIPALIMFAALAAAHWLLPEWQRSAGLVTLLLVTGLITVFGGRVIPFFTARRFQLPQRDKIAVLEIASHIGVLALLFAVGLDLPKALWGWLSLALGLLQLVRCWRWRPSLIWREPLLWSLHVSYWFVILGFLMAFLAWTGIAPGFEGGALHALAVGGIGGMILAMISRVTLGHTGRTLACPRLMPLAFVALLVAALARIFWAPAGNGFLVAVCGWLLGYGLYLYYYAPMLTAPRADGQAG